MSMIFHISKYVLKTDFNNCVIEYAQDINLYIYGLVGLPLQSDLGILESAMFLYRTPVIFFLSGMCFLVWTELCNGPLAFLDSYVYTLYNSLLFGYLTGYGGGKGGLLMQPRVLNQVLLS